MAPDNKSLQKAFGAVLRRARTGCGISQERLALDSGLDRSYISLLERGLRQPTLTTIVVLAKMLNTDAADLVRQSTAGLK